MAGLRVLLLAVVLALAAGALPPEWLCKKDLAYLPDAPPPTDVAVDKQGRIYLLYGSDSFLDIYTAEGQLLGHRGGVAEEKHAPRAVTAQSLWVGRLGATALLTTDQAQNNLLKLLVPTDDGQLKLLALRKPKDLQMPAPLAVARDLDGNWYVWSGSTIAIFGSDGLFDEKVTLPPMKRPVQLAVNSQGNLYCLDAGGLHVFGPKGGEPKFEVAGAQIMYLTGADRLAAVGPDWLRRYSPTGRIEFEVKEPPYLEQGLPTAVSLNDQNGFFLYLRDGARGDGNILKLDAKGEVLQTFPQPVRFPTVPDSGFRLDFEGRVQYWVAKNSTLVKFHPGGKQERSLSYVPGADPQGRMQNPSELVVDKNGIVWISDSGNSRLQRFSLAEGGWLKPVPIGIKGGPARAIPRALAINAAGAVMVVVHPPSAGGEVLLQTLDPKGELISQRSLGSNRGLPVVKLAVAANGELWVYRSRSGLGGGPIEENPSLERFDPRGNKIASLGPDGRIFHYPEDTTARITLRPQEDLVPYRDGMLLAVQGRFLFVSPEFEVTDLAVIRHPRGSKGGKLACEFGGATLQGDVLWVTDTANRCLHRVPIPR